MNHNSDQSPTKSPQDRPRDKTPLYVALGAVCLALIGIGIDQFFEGRILRGVTIIAAVILWIVVVALLKIRYKVVTRVTDSD